MNAVVSVASTASAAAVAAPSISAAQPTNETSMPELAAKFADLCQRFRTKIQADQEDQRQFEAALFEKTGIIFRRGDDKATYPEWYEKERDCFIRAWPYADPELTEWTNLQADLFPIADDILERTATTVADIVLQMQAAAMLNSELWLESKCVELYVCCPSRTLRMLSDSIAKFAGTDSLPGLPILPISEVFFLPLERGGVVGSDPGSLSH